MTDPVLAPQAPPRKLLVAYRVFGVRLPEQYGPWVAKDVRTGTFLWMRSARTYVWGLAFFGLYAVGQRIGLGDWPARVTVTRAVLILLAVALLSSRDVLARRMLQWQRVDAEGEPVEPRRLARLSQAEAALLGLLVVVAWVGGSTAFGYGLRPTGIAAAKCQEPDPQVWGRITAGLTKKDTKFIVVRSVSYTNATLVAALIETPGKEHPAALEAWVVQPENVYRLSASDEGTTKFPIAPQGALDRVATQALQRVLECISKDAPR